MTTKQHECRFITAAKMFGRFWKIRKECIMENKSNKVRAIKDEFITSLQNGELSELKKMVKERKDLIICFRNKYINVYYKSHCLFKIEYKPIKKQYRVEFNLGHARYTKDWKTSFEKLQADIPSLTYNENNYIAGFYIDEGSKPFDFSKITGTYIRYINDFFDPGKTTYYIKQNKTETTTSKDNLKEKRHQQRFFSEHFGNDDKFLVFDIEYTIPRDNSSEQHWGSPDCLALKMADGMPVAIVLVEIKSTVKACNGKCGIKPHLKKYDSMINEPSYHELINRCAKEAICLYNKLGLLNIPDNAVNQINDLPLEKLFVFTSKEVEGYYKKLQNCEKMFVDYDI